MTVMNQENVPRKAGLAMVYVMVMLKHGVLIFAVMILMVAIVPKKNVSLLHLTTVGMVIALVTKRVTAVQRTVLIHLSACMPIVQVLLIGSLTGTVMLTITMKPADLTAVTAVHARVWMQHMPVPLLVVIAMIVLLVREWAMLLVSVQMNVPPHLNVRIQSCC